MSTSQDTKDGRALRRLLEALPDHRDYWVEMQSPIDGFPFVVTAAGIGSDLAEGEGKTIAEAADAARAKLKRAIRVVEAA